MSFRMSDSPPTNFRAYLRERRGEVIRELYALDRFEEWFENPEPELAELEARYDASCTAVLAAMGEWFEQPIPDRDQIVALAFKAIDEFEEYLNAAYQEIDPDGMIVGVLNDHISTKVNLLSRQFVETLRDAIPPESYPARVS